MFDPTRDATRAHAYSDASFRSRLGVPDSVLTYMHDHARSGPQRPFLTTIARDGAERTLTFGELARESAQLGAWLRDHLGVVAGEPVALLPANDLESVIAVFALMRCGVPILMLHPGDPPARGRMQAEALGAAIALRSPQLSPEVMPEAHALPEREQLRALHAAAFDEAPRGVDSPALYFGTSGSTAASKLVAQSHGNATANAEALCAHHRLVPTDRVLGCLPIHHVNALHFTVFATLAAGAHALLGHAFDPFTYPEWLSHFRPRIASVVPSILDVLVAIWRDRPAPSGLDYFVTAAAPLRARTARDVQRVLGARIVQGYGLTETTNFSTTMPPDLSASDYARLVLEADIPSVGIALPGNDVEVLRADGTRADAHEVGEVCMRGHNVMLRYQGNDLATEAAFRDGWFHSQDLGYRIDDPSGRSFFVLTGRTKNIAKVRGEAVSLDEVDRVLLSLPGVLDAGSVALESRMLGEEVVAAVVLGPEMEVDAVRRHLSGAFAAAVVPRRVVVLDAIPRSPTGKLRRRELAGLLQPGAFPSADKERVGMSHEK